MDSSKKYDNPSPETTANPLSKIFFWWIIPFFKYGYKHDLEVKDIFNTAPADLSEPLGDTLEKNWTEELDKATKNGKRPSLLAAISKTYLRPYSLFGVVLFFYCCVLKMLQPVVLGFLIKFFEPGRPYTVGEGWFLTTTVVLISLLDVTTIHLCNLGQARLGMRCRVACCSLIYRKLLRLNKGSTQNTAAGLVVNLMSNDVARFDVVPFFLHYIWIMPIQTIIAAGIMFNSVQYAAFAGLLFITLQAVPLQGYLSRMQGQLRFKIAQKTDHRVQMMNELTCGIKVIKMYAWEKPFQKVVALARKLEIDDITTTSYIKGFSVALMVFTERCTVFLTVVTYVLLGNRLTSDKVFSLAQIFNTVQLYMSIFYPLALATYAEAKTSIKRLEEFLLQEEVHAIKDTEIIDSTNDGTVSITKGKASWIPHAIVDTLTNINLDIKPGTLCAVVGQVGAGKSSLLQLLLKELPLNSGHLEITGRVSFASQEPWLFVSSIRNNVLFGLPYLKEKYKEVVKVCALERDFELFPNKDRTLVGERGVSLSGGQRARINLARAVYRQADIYLFDDPLSAVDTHVGKHLFEECILKYLKNRTRILVTHQLQFLKQADLIVVMNNGQIEKVSTYNELTEDELKQLKQEPASDHTIEEQLDKEVGERKRLLSITSGTSTSVDEEEVNEPAETQELVGKGAIPTSLYVEYFRAGASIAFLLFLVIALILAQAACNGGDLWLTHWTNREEARYYAQTQPKDSIDNDHRMFANDSNLATPADFLYDDYSTTDEPFTPENATLQSLSQVINDTLVMGYEIADNESEPIITNTLSNEEHSQNFYIYIYTTFILLGIALMILRSLVFYRICMNASTKLHNTMFSNILQATMRFFDTNPSGRILNRFSKDMGAVDEILPYAMLQTIQIFLVMSGILLMVFIVTPWMVAIAFLLVITFWGIRTIYLASAQDVKRLEGITRAPVFSHVSASLSGLTTIRSSQAQSMVMKEFDTLQDKHTGSWFLFMASSEAFGLYLDLISVGFLTILTFQFLIFDDGTTLSGNVGLVISQSLILTGMLQYGMRQTAEVASQMTSVERIVQYTKLDKEGPFESLPTKKPLRDWPPRGAVEFKNVSLRYVPTEDPVLRNLNIAIKAGEKVGIVGRTGAGKSSLMSALFRLAPTEGAVIIDGVDTATIGLHELRTKISIIPQEPVLFSSTVRHNLDPFSKSEDKALWQALEDVELKDAIESLDHEVSESGANFSAGQRQLICLARAILRNNQVLVMDEATANVDPQTDALIQKTIRENFKNCTVLTIAHRLNTVMDSDKVLVMEAGEMVEFGHPHELLQNENGHFTGMVKKTGPAMENNLRKIAADALKSINEPSDNNRAVEETESST